MLGGVLWNNFWDCGSSWCIVQAFVLLCMERKIKKSDFISVTMCFFSHSYTLAGNPVRLIQEGIMVQAMQCWHRLVEVFSCQLLCATCKTNSQVQLQNYRISVTFFLNASLSFLPFHSLCAARFDFALLAWILPFSSELHHFLQLIYLLFSKATEVWQLAVEWSGTLETCSNLSLSSTYFVLCS